MKLWLLLFSFFLASLVVNCQPIQPKADSSNVDDNKVVKDNTPFSWKQNPKVAAWMSTILPGAGQAYNKKYWKIPIIWSAFGVLGYFIVQNNKDYSLYKKVFNYKSRLQNKQDTAGVQNMYNDIVNQNPDLKSLSVENLAVQKNYYRRQRDFFIIITSLIYVINIVDASVDAHLSKFDVSDNLSMNILPATFSSGPLTNISAVGLAFQFNFKK